MPDDIRVGLIGYGSWGRNAFAPALENDGRARIVAAAAKSEASRSRIRAELGREVHVFESYKALCSGPEIDAVMIAVPDDIHEEVLYAFMDRDVAVFYEPPVADTRDAIRPILKRMIHSVQIMHADLELGYAPIVAKIADIVKSGALSDIQTATVRLQADWGVAANDDICTIHHLAPWFVDVLNRVLDMQPKRVLTLDGHGTPGRRQHHSIAHFDYDGVWGTFQVNTVSVGGTEIAVEINGDDADLVADVFNHEIRMRTRKNPQWSVIEFQSGIPVVQWPGEQESVSAFLDAIETGKPSRSNARLIAHLHLVGLAAEASKDLGVWVDVEDISVLLADPETLA